MGSKEVAINVEEVILQIRRCCNVYDLTYPLSQRNISDQQCLEIQKLIKKSKVSPDLVCSIINIDKSKIYKTKKRKNQTNGKSRNKQSNSK